MLRASREQDAAVFEVNYAGTWWERTDRERDVVEVAVIIDSHLREILCWATARIV